MIVLYHGCQIAQSSAVTRADPLQDMVWQIDQSHSEKGSAEALNGSKEPCEPFLIIQKCSFLSSVADQFSCLKVNITGRKPISYRTMTHSIECVKFAEKDTTY